MYNDLILKNNLKQARVEHGMSQSELAALVGVSRNTISAIETQRCVPTAKLAYTLCFTLDKKFDEIFYLIERQLMTAQP